MRASAVGLVDEEEPVATSQIKHDKTLESCSGQDPRELREATAARQAGKRSH